MDTSKRSLREAPATNVIDFDKVVDGLKERGIPAYVEQTGGGTATIMVGEQKTRTVMGVDEDGRYDVLVGPGWFEGPMGFINGRGDTGDLSIGPDDDGVADYTQAEADWTEAEVIAEVVRQMGKGDA